MLNAEGWLNEHVQILSIGYASLAVQHDRQRRQTHQLHQRPFLQDLLAVRYDTRVCRCPRYGGIVRHAPRALEPGGAAGACQVTSNHVVVYSFTSRHVILLFFTSNDVILHFLMSNDVILLSPSLDVQSHFYIFG